jgi:addiction module HigA family antidote
MKIINSERPEKPGDVILNKLKDKKMTQYSLALAMKSYPSNINNLVKSKRRISLINAIKLSNILGESILFWVNLQNKWDLWEIKKNFIKKEKRENNENKKSYKRTNRK